MPYEMPTLAQFRTRFPIFDDAEDDLVKWLLDEAKNGVSTSWAEPDYQPAILYLAAHLLATDNSAEGEAVGIGSSGSGSVKSESLGGLSISYGADAGATTKYNGSAYGSTEYGRRYLDILWRNVPAVMVV